ncbi:hypothetical protein BU25DRAFT_337377, partial [Macroventuria anomochaeta]
RVTRNVPACRSSPHHGSHKGGPRDDGFKRGMAHSGPASEAAAELKSSSCRRFE